MPESKLRSGVRILVVDDDWDDQVFLTRTLTRAGAVVTIADSLDMVRDILAETRGGNGFGLVLVRARLAPHDAELDEMVDPATTPVFFLTKGNSPVTTDRPVITLPVDEKSLLETVRGAVS